MRMRFLTSYEWLLALTCCSLLTLQAASARRQHRGTSASTATVASSSSEHTNSVSSWLGPEFTIVRRVYDDCQDTSDFIGCLKQKALQALNRALEQDSIKIVDGLVLEKQNQTEKESFISAITDARTISSLSPLDRALLWKADKLARTHALKVDMSTGRVKDATSYIVSALKSLLTLSAGMLRPKSVTNDLQHLTNSFYTELKTIYKQVVNTKVLFEKAHSPQLESNASSTAMPLPTIPCLRHWGKCMKAAIYYCNHFNKSATNETEPTASTEHVLGKQLDLASADFTCMVFALDRFGAPDISLDGDIRIPDGYRHGDDEGHHKKKKDGGHIKYVIAALLTAMGIAGPIGLKALAAIAGKALVISKVALTIASIIALKKLFSHDHHEETSFQVHAGEHNRRNTYVIRPMTKSNTPSAPGAISASVDPYRYYYEYHQ